MALSPAARLTLANLFFRQHNGEVESIAKGTQSKNEPESDRAYSIRRSMVP